MELRLTDAEDACPVIYVRESQPHHLAAAKSCAVEKNECHPHDCGTHRRVHCRPEVGCGPQHPADLCSCHDDRSPIWPATREAGGIRDKASRLVTSTEQTELAHEQLTRVQGVRRQPVLCATPLFERLGREIGGLLGDHE